MDKTTLMSGKVCLVTGANAGLGRAITLGLARIGATVVMVCRSRERGETAQAEISAASGNPAVDLLLADLSRQGDIRRLAEAFKAKYQHLHVRSTTPAGSSTPAPSPRVVSNTPLPSTTWPISC